MNVKIKEYDKAFDSYQQALAIDMNFELVWNDLGTIFLIQKKYDKARIKKGCNPFRKKP